MPQSVDSTSQARSRHRLRPDRHRPGVRVRLLGHAGLQGAAGRRPRGRARQQQPGDDHDRPGAGRSHLRRAADGRSARRDHRARAARRAAADRRRPDRAQPRRAARPRAACSQKYNVELIGASIEAIKVAEDRLLFSDAMREIGLDVPEQRLRRGRSTKRSRPSSAIGFPIIIRPSFTLGGVGGGIAYNIEEFREIAQRGLEPQPGARGPARGVGDRLEGVRARGDARRRRQLRRHLLDREHRSDGRAHRRQHHRRAGADADRQGIPADARRRRAASSAASASRPAARTSSSRSTPTTAGSSSSR